MSQHWRFVALFLILPVLACFGGWETARRFSGSPANQPPALAVDNQADVQPTLAEPLNPLALEDISAGEVYVISQVVNQLMTDPDEELQFAIDVAWLEFVVNDGQIISQSEVSVNKLAVAYCSPEVRDLLSQKLAGDFMCKTELAKANFRRKIDSACNFLFGEIAAFESMLQRSDPLAPLDPEEIFGDGAPPNTPGVREEELRLYGNHPA